MTSDLMPSMIRTRRSTAALRAVVSGSSDHAMQRGALGQPQIKRRRLLGPSAKLMSDADAIPTYDYETHVSYARRSKHIWRPANRPQRVPDGLPDPPEMRLSQPVEASPMAEPVSESESFQDAVEQQSVKLTELVLRAVPAGIEQCITEQAPADVTIMGERPVELPISRLPAISVSTVDVSIGSVAPTPTASPRSSRADGTVLTEDIIDDEWAFITEQPKAAAVTRDTKMQANTGRRNEIRITVTPLTGADGIVRGAFSDSEREIIMSIFEKHTADGNAAELENMIQHSWPKLKAFKADLQAALPMRTMISLSKFCKRHFHHLRGPWTEDEDLVLQHCAEMYPGQWTKIADLIGDRSAEECRQHYRNVVKEHNTGPWTLEEERRLIKIVEESLDKIGGDRDPNKLDWPTVARQYESRNGRQCRRKYMAMSHRQKQPTYEKAPLEPSPGDRRVTKAEKDAKDAIRQFQVGDFYDVLYEIRSVPIDSRYQHDTTFWSIIAKAYPQSRFSSLVRRHAFEMALDGSDWEDKSSMTIPEQAVMLSQRIFEEYDIDQVRSQRGHRGLTSGPIKGYAVLDPHEPGEESNHVTTMPLRGEPPRTPDSLSERAGWI